MRYLVKTFGCRVNQAETIQIEKDLQDQGFLPVLKNQKPDLAIINSCVVTQKAEKEVQQMARSLRRRYPRIFLVVAGCGPAYWKLAKKDFRTADFLINNRQKGKIGRLLKKKLAVFSQPGIEKEFLSRFTSVRALVKIQDGCNQFCPYCIVPYLRREPWSKPIREVLAEINQWLERGVREIVFTGINLKLYQYGLDRLLKEVLEKTEIARIRFGSISLEALSDKLIDLYKKEYQKSGAKTRLCRHFHIPIQSGSSPILNKMGRKYTPGDFQNLLAKIRRKIPGAVITTDLIVGFPEESQKDFEKSLRAIEKLAFLKVHLFRFSPRTGTLAAEKIKSGQWQPVNPRIIKRRAKKAAEIAQKIRKKELAKLKDLKLAVLFEKQAGPGVYEGYTDNFIRVRKKSDRNLVNQIRLVKWGRLLS